MFSIGSICVYILIYLDQISQHECRPVAARFHWPSVNNVTIRSTKPAVIKQELRAFNVWMHPFTIVEEIADTAIGEPDEDGIYERGMIHDMQENVSCVLKKLTPYNI